MKVIRKTNRMSLVQLDSSSCDLGYRIKDFSKMLTFMHDIDSGLVRINAESAGVELQAPFGGMKMSSSGEQGQAAIEFYTDMKTVFIKS